MTIAILKQHEFLPEHKQYILEYQESVKCISNHHRNLIMGVKDVESRYIVTNTAHALAIGSESAEAMLRLTDADMPCVDTSSYAEQYQSEDVAIIETRDITATSSYLKVHHYANGFKAIIIYKSVAYHEKTDSILGIIFHGHEINMLSLFNIATNFSNLNTTKIKTQIYNKLRCLTNGVRLTAYEYEISYLLTLNWQLNKIAEFMNRIRIHNYKICTILSTS